MHRENACLEEEVNGTGADGSRAADAQVELEFPRQPNARFE